MFTRGVLGLKEALNEWVLKGHKIWSDPITPLIGGNGPIARWTHTIFDKP